MLLDLWFHTLNSFSSGRLRYWDGAQWRVGATKRWDGAEWVPADIAVWDGSNWQS